MATNPLDFPRYVRSLRPSLPESLPNYVDDELEKVSTSLQELEQASNNHAESIVNEERVVRVSEDEALAARIVSVEAEFSAGLSDTDSRVATEEIARTTADEALASRLSTLETEYVEADDEIRARIEVEELARSTAEEALAARLTTIESDFAGESANTNARLTQEQITRATEDEALATAITTLSATVGTGSNKTFFQTSAPTATVVGDLWFDTDDSNKVYRWSGSAWDPADDGRIAVNAAAITTEATARASGDSANASSITTLTTTVSGLSSTVSSYSSSISGLQAKYGVKLDVNGYVSGFEQNNGSGTSDFIIRADKFQIIMPGYAGGTPFTVDSGGVKINGNLVVDGTVTTNKLNDLSVTTGKINDNAVTNLAYAFTAGEGSYITSDTTWADQQSLTVTSTGAPAKISMGVLTVADSVINLTFRLLRDSTVLIEDMYAFASPGVTDSLFYEIVDTPPSSGTYTYKLQAKKINIAEDNNARTSKRYLASLELKK